MGYEPGLGVLVEQIKQASANIAEGDARTHKRIDELAQSVNALYLKHGRPGGWEIKDDEVAVRRMIANAARGPDPDS